MGKFGAKLHVLLGLWIFFVQGAAVFASTLTAIPADEDLDYEIRQTPVSGADYFEQIDILEVQPAPQKERPDFFDHGSTATSVFPQKERRNSPKHGFYLLDHRNNLRHQIFPFHFHW